MLFLSFGIEESLLYGEWKELSEMREKLKWNWSGS